MRQRGRRDAQINRQKIDYRALPRRFRRKRLLIVGCGDVGQRIAALVRKDWQVFGVARSAQTLDAIRAAGAVPLAAGGRRRRLQGLATWVVYAAPPARPESAATGAAPAGHAKPITVHDSAVAADPLVRSWTAKLLGPTGSSRASTAPRTGGPVVAKRLVYLSTTGVYGDRQGRSTPEETPVRPTSDRARRRVEAERWLRTPARRPGGGRLRVTILRVPGIYALDRLPIRRLQEGLPALLPCDDVQTNHIHADDLARLTRAALFRGRAQRVLNTVDDSKLSLGEYLDLVADWAQLPRPPKVDRETLLASVSPIRASFMTESRRLPNRRMKRELRLALRYPTVADFLATCQSASENGAAGS